ncbi:MAG: TetR family transcriptional regulator [Solirubrobacteraceae bacterium]|nr:TetR family transcriptional regulator [Solirubrobacteraceae bacterium]
MSDPSTVMSRRDEILAVSARLFGQQGYHAVGMRAIADAVGIRGSSLYHHFPSKADILGALAYDYVHQFIEEHLPGPDDPRAPDEILRALLREQVIFFWHHREERSVGLRELKELEPDVYEKVQGERRAYQRALEALVARGVSEGVFDVDDPRLSVVAVLGLVQSVNGWFHEDGTMSLEQVADAYAAMAVDRLFGAKR